MTLAEMQQATINHWATHFRGETKKLGKEGVIRQSRACALLTRKEMDNLIQIGLDEETAWTEARNLYCIAPPPKSDLY